MATAHIWDMATMLAALLLPLHKLHHRQPLPITCICMLWLHSQEAANCAFKGFAAVLMDFSHEWSATGLTQTMADWPPYFDWLVSSIDNMGLSVGPVDGRTYMSNATLLSKMDFGLSWTCVEFGHCSSYMPLGESLRR